MDINFELRTLDLARRTFLTMDITQLRQSARQIWEAALEAGDPAACLHRAIQPTDKGFSIRGKEFEIGGRLIVIGSGKASPRMARTLEELLGERISDGLVVTKYGHGLPLEKMELVEAGHPVPDAKGQRAAMRTHELLWGLDRQDLVICLISGGGSALWVAPADDISLEEKQEVTLMLLRAGATIRELNTVRKHLSLLKGGQLARYASPAQVVSLIMSDVIGDPLDVIASGPTAPDTTTFADALSIMKKYGVPVSDSITGRLTRGARGEIPETPKPGDPVFETVENYIIGNNHLLVESATQKARKLGFNTLLLSTEIEGEARDIGRFLAAIAREIAWTQNPIAPPACILGAGETTVTVRGNGVGGRNQEMALAWAISMQAFSRPACFASVATDGSDGPSTAAGALVDPHTCGRAAEFGLEPLKFLRTNDSFNFLKATRDLIITGPTQTNLMDLQILLVG